MNNNIEHWKICIHGHVQGVFFRQSALQEARLLNLTGTVRNNEDGTVAIEAEGPPAVLAALEAWCHKGPSTARVEQVEATQGEVQGYESFEIQR